MSGSSRRGNVVVVAHPDDEALWLTSVLPSADVVVATLPRASQPLTERRRAVVAEYPLSGFELLDLQSADVYWQIDPRRCRPVEHGLSLRENCPTPNAERYRLNFYALLEELEKYFHPGSVVYTHNPWGEYGHPEHVQVSNAVVRLARKHSCSVWIWEGFSSHWQLRRGLRLRADYYPDRLVGRLPAAELPLDLELYRELRGLYIRHDAWTWDDDYEPPAPSRFVQIVDGGVVLLPAGRRRASAPARMTLRAAAGRTRRLLPDLRARFAEKALTH